MNNKEQIEETTSWTSDDYAIRWLIDSACKAVDENESGAERLQREIDSANIQRLYHFTQLIREYVKEQMPAPLNRYLAAGDTREEKHKPIPKHWRPTQAIIRAPGLSAIIIDLEWRVSTKQQEPTGVKITAIYYENSSGIMMRALHQHGQIDKDSLCWQYAIAYAYWANDSRQKDIEAADTHGKLLAMIRQAIKENLAAISHNQ